MLIDSKGLGKFATVQRRIRKQSLLKKKNPQEILIFEAEVVTR